jgi:3-dehydroquinate synthase
VKEYFKNRISRSAAIKQQIVMADPKETGIRAALNFGHTIGHAIEAWALENRSEPFSHGESIAAGMICEAFLSARLSNLPEEIFHEIIRVTDQLFPRLNFNREERGHILEKIRYDKKRLAGNTRMSLVTSPGIPAIGVNCSTEMVADALHFYAAGT